MFRIDVVFGSFGNVRMYVRLQTSLCLTQQSRHSYNCASGVIIYKSLRGITQPVVAVCCSRRYALVTCEMKLFDFVDVRLK